MVIICIVNSWYHGLGAYSYLLETLGRKKQVEKIIFYSGGFFDAKVSCLSFFDFDQFGEKFEVVEGWAELDGAIGRISSDDECLLITPSKLPYYAVRSLVNNDLKFSMLLVEEGIGSYGGFVQDIKAAVRESRGWRRKIRALFAYGYKKLVISKYSASSEKWLNFNSDGSLNDRVVKAYRKALVEISSQIDEDIPDFDVVFLTSPFVELGLQSKEEYLTSLVKEGVKGRVLVKPHPIERINKYEKIGFTVYSGGLSSELILMSMFSKPEVYCFSSTSLYTSKIFFDLKVCRMKEGDKFYSSLSRSQKKIIDLCSV